jgi:hypothetical protein
MVPWWNENHGETVTHAPRQPAVALLGKKPAAPLSEVLGGGGAAKAAAQPLAPGDVDPRAPAEVVAADLALATPKEDTGTGVFGDLPRLDKKWHEFQRKVEIRDRRRAAGLFGEVDLAGLYGDEESQAEVDEAEAHLRERKYLVGRRNCGGGESAANCTLEEDMVAETAGGHTAPFERYVFTRGQAGPSVASQGVDRSVGFFKGLVRIVEFDPKAPDAKEQAAAASARRKEAKAEQLKDEAEHAARKRFFTDFSLDDTTSASGGLRPPSESGGAAAGAAAGAASLSTALVAAGPGGGDDGGDQADTCDLYNFEMLLGAPKTYVAKLHTSGQALHKPRAVASQRPCARTRKHASVILAILCFSASHISAPPPFFFLLPPVRYKVRLYVMRGLHLAAMDPGFGGRPGKSDPYLRVTCGKKVYDNRKNFVEDVVECDFFDCVEMDVELPGAPLTVEVKQAHPRACARQTGRWAAGGGGEGADTQALLCL